MEGNVWQWVQDWYGKYPRGSVTNPTGAADNDYTGSYRVIRGGGWNYDAQYLRSADRDGVNPGGRNSVVGFRLVRTAN